MKAPMPDDPAVRRLAEAIAACRAEVAGQPAPVFRLLPIGEREEYSRIAIHAIRSLDRAAVDVATWVAALAHEQARTGQPVLTDHVTRRRMATHMRFALDRYHAHLEGLPTDARVSPLAVAGLMEQEEGR